MHSTPINTVRKSQKFPQWSHFWWSGVEIALFLMLKSNRFFFFFFFQSFQYRKYLSKNVPLCIICSHTSKCFKNRRDELFKSPVLCSVSFWARSEVTGALGRLDFRPALAGEMSTAAESLAQPAARPSWVCVASASPGLTVNV